MREAFVKRTLVMITGPYQLLQALWYYSVHPEDEYVALLKLADTNEQVKKNLTDQCGASGIFKDIVVLKGVSIDSSLFNKAGLFLKMFLFYITGRRKALTEKIIKSEIGDMQYDSVLVDSENSILGGAFIDHADKKYTMIMQEGLSDIMPRRDKPVRKAGEIIGYILARMGYCNPSFFYKMKTTGNCYKMSSVEQLMKYRNFKGMIRLFSDRENELYSKIVNRTFSKMDWPALREADVLLITAPLKKIGGGTNEYEALHRWLKQQYPGRTILIKKHPRDDYPYQWDDMKIQEVSSGIPAEILLSEVRHQHVVMSFISTCVLDILNTDVKYYVTRFKTITDHSYDDKFDNLQSTLDIAQEHIIAL